MYDLIQLVEMGVALKGDVQSLRLRRLTFLPTKVTQNEQEENTR